MVWARRLGVEYESVRAATVRLDASSFAFSSERKRMTTVCTVPDRSAAYRIHTKGAAEIVLALCTRALDASGQCVPLQDAQRALLQRAIFDFASSGLRTLILAYRDTDAAPMMVEEAERDLILLALVGIRDPVRAEVPAAVRACQKAGLVVRMVTGDNLQTAKRIATECGILGDNSVAIEGPAFRVLSDRDKQTLLPHLRVMARSSPADKYDLVRRLRRMGEVVAVTGDGTNDAPALKEADVGFSMGRSGTQIAMNASDIVLLDDNFGSIVKAIRWGRNVFDSIRKFLQFQLSVNLTAIVLTFAGSAAEGRSPLSAVQLLWVNLIMDTFGALALATDEPAANILERPPNSRLESLVNRGMLYYIMFQCGFQSILLLALLFSAYSLFGVDAADTVAIDSLVFTTFVLFQVANIVAARGLTLGAGMLQGMLRNRLFLLIVSVILLVQVILVQFGGDFTGTVRLSAVQWAGCAALAVANLLAIAALRLLARRLLRYRRARQDRVSRAESAPYVLPFELQEVDISLPHLLGIPHSSRWTKLRAATRFLSMYSRLSAGRTLSMDSADLDDSPRDDTAAGAGAVGDRTLGGARDDVGNGSSRGVVAAAAAAAAAATATPPAALAATAAAMQPTAAAAAAAAAAAGSPFGDDDEAADDDDDDDQRAIIKID